MQPKKLSKPQIGPRLTKCPMCHQMTARVESVINSVGKTHRKIVCHAINCRSERQLN